MAAGLTAGVELGRAMPGWQIFEAFGRMGGSVQELQVRAIIWREE